MSKETVGEAAHLFTADHPARSDSPTYRASRKWLMATYGGCFVCGGPVDLSHPELLAVANAKGLEDHHGNGITYKGVLVAMGLVPTEWSLGWAADPDRVAGFVSMTNELLQAAGEATYDAAIVDTASVMAWVDSRWNASIKLCRPHHIGTQTQHTPDVNGHEAVGIHEIPLPIWAGQATCQWDRFDMWSGTTGTLAVAPHADENGPVAGHAVVLHAHAAAHPGVKRGDVLPPHHPHARLAHAGAHVDRPAA